MSQDQQASSAPVGADRLRGDCDRCSGLCCVAPGFSASADFAIDKAAGHPCPNLGPDSRCDVHAGLRPLGFPGCAVYDCFGAGQRVTQVTFGGQDWRTAPQSARQIFEVFTVMRQLHELLWYLREALTLLAAGAVHGELRQALDETERLADQNPKALLAIDVAACRRDVNRLLMHVSELARAHVRRPVMNGAGADLIGADLQGRDLTGANLRGAYLVGADLQGADLAVADLTGADLRGANLAGADLGTSIFVTQSQLDAAVGDGDTRLPPARSRPHHWTSSRGVRKGT